jgi:predicted phage gp36 major capsid-like protein
MSKEIIEKLDAIEAQQYEKIVASEEKAFAAIDAAKVEMSEQISALEAKISTVQAPAIIKVAKTVASDVNRSVREQLSNFYKGNGRVEKELKIFADESQYQAYMNEAAGLTGSGLNQGGRTNYDPTFTALRQYNPMRGLSRQVATDGSSYQFRVRVGNPGEGWGYTVNNNTGDTTVNTSIWQMNLQDLNVGFPIRTAALDDIDGLESVIVSDMLASFSQSSALSMVKNNDQAGSTTTSTGAENGLRGLNSYPGDTATYTPGTCSVASFGTSGTGASNGLHNLATYDQITTNANTVGANNIQYKDVINMMMALPQAYWNASNKFMVSPILAQAIRGLQDDNGRPIFNSTESLNPDGIIGRMLGYDVVQNTYCDAPFQAEAGSAGNGNLYPMYFGAWDQFHTICDRMNMVLRRYDQTVPGSIYFYAETRLATSVKDPNAGIRYRSTGTAT